ncbi:helix-turn-helix domain-containing protein [Weissella cibaria]|uniref:helix-turn-helix domain-containing protein n=1 Tax=Weissella cibaria TaxID=137591 RepID=UPI00106E38FA|nr:helix-turn-helix transcriptional regulator [Weissella cibaria]
MTLFERIKETAKERGISLTALSVESGLGEKTIYKWKDKEPSASRIKAVADVLGVSVDYLLGNTDEMHGDKNSTVTDLDEILNDTPILSFNGVPVSDETRDVLKKILKMSNGDL